MRAERSAVADERADVFGIGEAIRRAQEQGTRAVGEDGGQRGRRGDFADGKDALVKVKADQLVQETSLGDEDVEVILPSFEQRREFFDAIRRQHDGHDAEALVLQEALHDFVAFGHEDA